MSSRSSVRYPLVGLLAAALVPSAVCQEGGFQTPINGDAVAPIGSIGKPGFYTGAEFRMGSTRAQPRPLPDLSYLTADGFSAYCAAGLPRPAKRGAEAAPQLYRQLLAIGEPFRPVIAQEVPAKNAAWEPAARAKEHPWMSIATWKKMHEGHLARTKKGGVDVAFLGDSITQGWDGAGAPEWKKRFEPLKAANYGIGGDTTREVLYRLNEGIFDGIKPKAVVLLIGTNNFGLFGDSAADTAKGVAAVVATVRKKAPGAKVLLLGIFPRDKAANTASRKKIAEANEAIAKIADGKTVVYLDIGKKFLADDGTLPAEVMPDALHLSEKGYGIWADAIEESLKTLLK